MDDSNEEKKSNPLDDILANALNTTKKVGDLAAGMETKKCKICGAARPDDTDLKFCDFCGNQFY